MSFDYDSLGQKSNRRSGYDIFISHSWSYDRDYERLVELLEDKNHFSFRNFSVPEEEKVEGKSKKALRRHIKNKQIEPASVVLIIAGMYSDHSYWIGKEIDAAKDLDKPIIGIEPHGSQRIPSRVKNPADKMVGWDKRTIVRAIRNQSP
jgi:hypothetical protein